jgi:single-stranded-DNA-specific exonuclease
MSSHKILNIASPDEILQDSLSRALGISKITAQLLINRGVRTTDQADKFLNSRISDLLDPFSFSEMALAVNFIKKAALKKDRAMVYGDYDVDGVTSLALLETVLGESGLDISHYIPHRVKEGYGLNKTIVKIAKEKKIKLLITADCGTNSREIVKDLKSLGIEVIITDHHEPSGSSAEDCASATINPKLNSSNYKFRDLAGVGVAYKLCQALTGETLEEDLDLVSLGTIADSVPLNGENRIIAKAGLQKLASTKRIGLKSLIQTSGIQNKNITTEFVSFILGPRLNASGRLDSAETALNLLLSNKEDEAQILAKTLESYNRQRQKIESRIMEEAQDLIDKEINFKEHKVMVVAKEGWHLGVLGIVAAKLADRFYRPAILISLNEGMCRGSGRSIKSFHLFNSLLECRGLLEAFGGHSHAIGMVIHQSNIDEFKSRINSFASQSMTLEDLIPSLDIDMELSLSALKAGFIEEMNMLEPFGEANPLPLFYTKGLLLKGEPRILARETIKFWATDGEFTYQALGFGMAALRDSLVGCESFDLVYTPKIDNWLGQESLLLEIQEIIFR